MSAVDGLHLFSEEENSPSLEATKESQPIKKPKDERYMVFVLENERFAVPLASCVEVIETPEFRAIPNTVQYFNGFFNLRGHVVGLMSLRAKFGYSQAQGLRTAAMVFSTPKGVLAVNVDRIDKILTIDSDEIDKDTQIKSNIPQEYLIGLSKENQSLIIIDLEKILTEDDWIKVKAAV